jgi:diaminopimelate epimerase
VLDANGSQPVSTAQVRQLCDRRRGVGADGLIRAIRPSRAEGAVAVMELFNSDGSRAEMSGNGIRCLAQALVMAGWSAGPEVVIATDSGVRTVTVHERVDAATQIFSVAMGEARVGADAPEWAGGAIRRAVHVDVGNPHLVVELAPGEAAAVEGDTEAVALVELGERVNAKVPGGANVHLLAVVDDGHVAIRSYERGAGPTQACGTGACAAAAAARAWGLVGARVTVTVPGGVAEVTLADEAVLRGPATVVAAVDAPVPAPGAGA